MAALVPGKLFTKSCTKMTLHERFTAYREQASATNTTFRDRILQQRQASAENRRLAQQMANRPSVIAALKLKKKSMQQRLGQKRSYQGTAPVKSRLNLGFRQSPKIQNRLGLRGRGRGMFRRGGINRSPSGSGFNRPGTSPMLKARLGTPRINIKNFSNRGTFRKRNFFSPKSANMSQRFKRIGGRGRARGGQSNRGRGGGGQPNRGRGGRNSWISRAKAMPSKTELDNELDQYMAETKNADRFPF